MWYWGEEKWGAKWKLNWFLREMIYDKLFMLQNIICIICEYADKYGTFAKLLNIYIWSRMFHISLIRHSTNNIYHCNYMSFPWYWYDAKLSEHTYRFYRQVIITPDFILIEKIIKYIYMIQNVSYIIDTAQHQHYIILQLYVVPVILICW